MPKPQQLTILDIKNKIRKYQGSEVRLEAHQSKKKLYQKTGFIEAIYPSIFTVSIKNNNDNRVQRMSFSYIDLLTQNVKIDVIDVNEANISL